MNLYNKLVSTSALNLLDYALKIGLVLVISPLLINHLGKEEYGLWVLLLSVIGYLDLLDLGFSQTAVRYLSLQIGKAEEVRQRITFLHFKSLYRKVAAVSCCISLVACLLLPFLLEDRILLKKVLMVTALGGGVFSATFYLRVYTILLKAHLLYDRLIFAGLCRLVVHAILTVVVIKSGGGIDILAVTWAAGIALEQFIIWFTSRHLELASISSEAFLDDKEKKEIRRYAGKNMAGLGARFLRERMDTQIIGAYVSMGAVTYYAVGSRLIAILTDVLNALFGGHFLSAFAQLEGKSGRGAAAEKLLITLGFSVPLALLGGIALFVLGPAFIQCWLGPGFEEAHQIVRILAIPTALIVMQSPASSYLASMNRHGMLATTTLLGAAFNLVGSLVLVQWLGLAGVVTATAIELMIASLFIRPWLIVREGQIRLGTYLQVIWRSIRVLAPVAALLEFALKPFLLEPTWASLVVASFCLSVALIVSVWLGVFDPATRSQILRYARIR